MKEDSFIKSLATIGVATVINLAVGFLTTPIITRLVEPVEFGQFSIFTMYSNLVLLVLCFGMDQSLVRFYYTSEDREFKLRLILECILVPIILSLVFIIISLLLIGYKIINFEFDWISTILLAIYIFEGVIFRFSALIVRLNYNNRLYGIIQVIQKGLYVVFSLLMVIVVDTSRINSLAIATVLASFVCVLFSLASQKEYIPWFGKSISIDCAEMKDLLRFGYPFVFSMGITSLFQSLDKLALNHYATYADVGIYTSAMAFVSLFAVIQSTFNIVWVPKAVQHYEKCPEDKGYYKTAFNIISVVMFAVGITLILFKDFFALLLGGQYRDAEYIMPFLIFHPIMYTISETTVCGIDFMKKSKMHVFIASGACLTNFLGNSFLVPIIGCRGAALSTGVSYIVFFILRTIIAEKVFPVRFNLLKLFIVTIEVFIYAAYNTFYEFGVLNVVFAIICYLTLYTLYRDTIKWCYR